jgi:hypothetical protein
MSNQPTVDLLKAMRLCAMAAELQRQMESPETYNQLSFDERMSLLTNAEWTKRQNNKVAATSGMPILRSPVLRGGNRVSAGPEAG